MSYDISNIINLQTRISPAGLGFANFGKACLFAPESELPTGFSTDTYRVYNNTADVSLDFDSTTETYKAAAKWLGGIPANNEITIYGVETDDASWTDTLNKARNVFWWYWTLVTVDVYDSEPDVLAISAWCDTNTSMFPNSQNGASASAIRDPNDTGDIASQLNALGHRHTYTFAHATDDYAGTALAKWFASVNYSVARSTITGEYKVLSGVATEDLTATANTAMVNKKACFYTVIDLQGSSSGGKVINSKTHSSYGEWIDDVVNLDAFVNAINVGLFNVITGQFTKLGQDPVGQALLIGSVKATCEQYITNGYLGPRNYTNPDDGQPSYTVGYEILTVPEDILDLSTEERAERLSAPIRVRIFRKGAIHKAIVNIDVF